MDAAAVTPRALPAHLHATAPAEARGRARDDVRLLVSAPDDTLAHARFRDLPRHVRAGDLLVVNASGTLPASLPARAVDVGAFRLNLCTRLDARTWLAEPRWSHARPGPLPLAEGATARVDGVRVRFLSQYPGIPRLWFVRADAPLDPVMQRAGAPIRYGYIDRARPLADYQTLFATTPGSAEMPSAARPFTPRVLRALTARGVRVARIILHTGVSSLEVDDVANDAFYPEFFHVPASTARAVNATHARGGRVLAVGTTVVRALESAREDEGRVRAARGFTRRVVHPGNPPQVVDGLLTGLHEPTSTHVAMLNALAGERRVRDAYASAVDAGYLWHEFGDVHLLWREGRA